MPSRKTEKRPFRAWEKLAPAEKAVIADNRRALQESGEYRRASAAIAAIFAAEVRRFERAQRKRAAAVRFIVNARKGRAV